MAIIVEKVCDFVGCHQRGPSNFVVELPLVPGVEFRIYVCDSCRDGPLFEDLKEDLGARLRELDTGPDAGVAL